MKIKVSLTLCPRWRPTLFALPNRRRPASVWSLSRIPSDWFSWSKFKRIEGHREPNRTKGTLVISSHQTSKRETIKVSIWSAQARTLGFGSSSTLTSKRQPPDFGSWGFWENFNQRVSDKLQKYLVHRPINFQNLIQTSTVPSSGRTLSAICVKLLSW